MSSDIQLAVKVKYDGKDVDGGITVSRDQFRKLAADAKAAGDAMSGGFTSAARGVRSVSDMLSGMRNLWVGSLGVRELAQASDAWTNLASRINLVAPSSDAARTAMAQVYSIAQQSGQSLAAIGDVYVKVARNAAQYNLTAKDTGTVTTAIANAVKLSGGSAESTSAALMQLGQALSSGTLRGEELNSVMEQTPALAEAIARGMGKTVGDLRKMGEAGQLAARDVLGAIIKESQRLESEVARMAPTIGQAVQQLQNALAQFAGGRNSAAGNAAAGVISGVASNLNGIADAALVAGSALAAMKVGGWVADAMKAVGAAGSLGAAIAQVHPAVRLLTLAVAAMSAAWVGWQRLGNATPIDGVADMAERTASALAKATSEVKKFSIAQYQAQVRSSSALLGDYERRYSELYSHGAADPALRVRARGGDQDAANRIDEFERLGVTIASVRASLETLRNSYDDVGSAAQEAFTKNDAFMSKEQKQTKALEDAGAAYARAWGAAAEGPPEQIATRRAEALAQYQRFIADTLDFKGQAEASADATVAHALAASKRIMDALKQDYDHFRIGADAYFKGVEGARAAALQASIDAMIKKWSMARDPKEKISLVGQMNEAQSELENLPRRTSDALDDVAKKGQEALGDLRAAAGVALSPLEAAALNFGKTFGEKIRRGVADGGQSATDISQAAADAWQAISSKVGFDDLGKQFDMVLKRMDVALANTQIGVQLGNLTQDAAAFANHGIMQTALPALMALRQRMQDMAGDSAYFSDSLADLDRKIAAVRGEVSKPLPPQNMFEAAQQAASGYVKDLGSLAQQQESMFRRSFQGMEDALVSFVQTGKLSFKSLANSIISDLVRIQVRESITKSMGGGGGGIGNIISSVSAWWGGTNPAFENGVMLASGGAVTGPGTGTSDSIPAMLSNGEYVLNAAAVRRVGVGMLDAINSARAGPRIARFADGGMVGAGGAATMPGVSVNSGASGVVLNQTVTINASGLGADVKRMISDAMVQATNAAVGTINKSLRRDGALARSAGKA